MKDPEKKYVPESLGRERLSDRLRPASIDKIPAEPKQSKFSKLANKTAVLALLLALFGVGTYLFWSFQSENVLEVKNSPFPVRTIRYHPTAGGIVILTVNICKNSNIVGKTRTSFVSESREIFLPVAEERLQKKCLENMEVPVLIPPDIPPGTYKIKFHVTYDINPVKRGVVKDFESKTFIVEPTQPTS